MKLLKGELYKKLKVILLRILLENPDEKTLKLFEMVIGKEDFQKMIEEINTEYDWILTLDSLQLPYSTKKLIKEIYMKSKKFNIEIPFFIVDGQITFDYSLQPHSKRIIIPENIINKLKKQRIILVHTHYSGKPASLIDRVFHLTHIVLLGVVYEKNRRIVLSILKGNRRDIEIEL